MFTIYGGATEFNQWDQNQRVMEPRLVAGDKVIFLNSSGMTYPMKAYSHNGEVVVDVPNKLLTMPVPVLVYINGYYETRTSFNVVAQGKPENYVFADNDDWPSDNPGHSGDAVEINLADYGIDLAAIAMSGQKTATVSGTKKMWEEINKNKNFVLLSAFDDGHLRINPTMTTHADGVTTSVALQVQAVIGGMMTISIVMGCVWNSVNGYGDETTISCVASTTAL